MVSVVSLLTSWWRQLPIEQTSGVRRWDFLLILRAYYRTGQLEERDRHYLMWVPDESIVAGPEWPFYEMPVACWWDQGGFFKINLKIVPASFNISTMVAKQSQSEQIRWRVNRYRLQKNLVYTLSGRCGAPTTLEGHQLLAMLIEAGVRVLPYGTVATQQDYARSWLAVWTVHPHLIDLVSYIGTRWALDMEPASIHLPTVAYVELFIRTNIDKTLTGPLDQWYHQYLVKILQNYIRTKQMAFRLEETIVGHPILRPVTAPVSLTHWGIGGETLTTMQSLISDYAARAPNYPEAMQRLLEQAHLQSA